MKYEHFPFIFQELVLAVASSNVKLSVVIIIKSFFKNRRCKSASYWFVNLSVDRQFIRHSTTHCKSLFRFIVIHCRQQKFVIVVGCMFVSSMLFVSYVLLGSVSFSY